MAEEAPEPETPESQWPAVPVAVQLVAPCYSWVLSRYEAADNRLGALVTLASSVTLGAPLLARALVRDGPVPPHGLSFWVGLICGGLAMAVALGARTLGGMQLPDPGHLLSKDWIGKSTWEVQRGLIYYASHAMTTNVCRIKRKAVAHDIATGLVIVEVLAFAVWLVTAR